MESNAEVSQSASHLVFKLVLSLECQPTLELLQAPSLLLVEVGEGGGKEAPHLRHPHWSAAQVLHGQSYQVVTRQWRLQWQNWQVQCVTRLLEESPSPWTWSAPLSYPATVDQKYLSLNHVYHMDDKISLQKSSKIQKCPCICRREMLRVQNCFCLSSRCCRVTSWQWALLLYSLSTCSPVRLLFSGSRCQKYKVKLILASINMEYCKNIFWSFS